MNHQQRHIPVSMTGIDFQKAPVALRERFAMTTSAATQKMRDICEEYGADGCILLCTCNRTELWVSGTTTLSPFELFCAVNGVDAREMQRYFSIREDHDAVAHLFALASGLKSQVFGEDQIITQVGTALTQAREAKTTDLLLEGLFRDAVTAAKRVKTEVRLTAVNRSAAVCTAEFLQQKLETLRGVPCMVIGNGEMGRLAATELVARGAAVTMTVRQYHHGDICVPLGVQVIPYTDRIRRLEEAKIVISATASPHYTIHASDIAMLSRPVIFCDLAVPRDIDPMIARLDNAQVFDTDQLCAQMADPENEGALRQAQAILEEQEQAFKSWYLFRPYIPLVREISGMTAQDLCVRIKKPVRGIVQEEEKQAQLLDDVYGAAGKAVERMLFGLRENLPPELWELCMQGLKRSVRKEETR